MADLGTYLGDVLLKAKVFGLATPPGEPPLQQAQLSVVGGDAVLGIPALKGDPGDTGAAAAPFVWQQPQLSSTGELPSGLGAGDKGKAWVINDGAGTADIAYWTGTTWAYFVDAFGPGLPGPAPDITATGELVDEADPFAVVVSGSAESPNLHFKVPSTPGPPGPDGGWDLYDDLSTTPAGAQLIWDAVAGKWVPTAPAAVPRVQRYTVPEAAFVAYSGSAASQTIASLALPTLPYPYHVDVHGHAQVSQAAESTARVALVVRLGDATSGDIVGKALPAASGAAVISPHYSSQDAGKQSIAGGPGSAAGRVPAATARSLFVQAVRQVGSGGWSVAQVDAQLSVTIIPDL